MRKKQLVVSTQVELPRTLGMTVRVGKLLGVNAEGQALVDYPGNPDTPLIARVLSSAFGGDATQRFVGESVLLVFENGDARLPIIVGGVQDQVTTHAPEDKPDAIARDGQDNIKVNGKQLRVDGRESVAITCGKSSIVLHADGRIVIKGANLVSRASESNKIKGAVVSLN